MVPGRHLPAVGTAAQVDPSEGSVSLKLVEESLPGHDPVCGGNTIATDLISSQPVPAALSNAETVQTPPQRPKCPQCGLEIPRIRDLRRPQGSSLSVRSSSRRSKSKGSVATLNQPAATPGDSCFELLLACLSCQCSVLLLGLLETCASCFSGLCACCCQVCDCCFSAVQDAPVEELNCHAHCHSVLFESCCEPTECLEFCLECCEICHRS